jgi:hypothetical protein
MGDVEGTLRIVRFDDDSGYAVVFAPLRSGGGALPQLRLATSEALRAFMLDLGVSEAPAEEILTELKASGSVSRHMVAPFEMLRRYELLQLGVMESILRYLSV